MNFDLTLWKRQVRKRYSALILISLFCDAVLLYAFSGQLAESQPLPAAFILLLLVFSSVAAFSAAFWACLEMEIRALRKRQMHR